MFVLIPYKGRSEQRVIAKGRLADCLSEPQREDLAEAMFANLIIAFDEFHQVNPEVIEKIFVVSKDRQALNAVKALSIVKKQTVAIFAEPETCQGLNDALNAAVEEAQQQGAKQCFIVHADLPLVRASDISILMNDAALQKSNKKRSDIHIVQDKSKTGTNGLIIPLPNPINFSFGVDSARKHVREALILSAKGYKTHLFQQEQLSFDLDEKGDLDALFAYHAADYFSPDNPVKRYLDQLCQQS